MAQAKSGNTVKVHYTGTFEDGTQFDSSQGREPLELTLGSGQVITGFEAAIVGMEPGESKTVNIPPEQAYGPRREEALQEFPRSAVPQHIDLQVGLQLQAQDPNGRPLLLTVASLSEDTVMLDANHPLAGKELTFNLELVEID
jgi:peptidylprolyl isomerase